MTQDRNKDLIRRWIAFANSGFAGNLDEFIAPDYVGHVGGSTMDRLELDRSEREFRRAFPDTYHSIDDLIAEDDRVVLRSTARATHHGEFQGLAPADRKVEFTAIVVYRIECTTIAESWGEIDFPRLMRQLRSAPSTGRRTSDQATTRPASHAMAYPSFSEPKAACPLQVTDLGPVPTALESPLGPLHLVVREEASRPRAWIHPSHPRRPASLAKCTPSVFPWASVPSVHPRRSVLGI